MDSIRRCSIDECDRKRSARGMCNLHYQRNLKHGDPLWEPMTMEDRFWAKVLPTGFCWEWAGALDPNGYGVFNVGNYVDRAHRVSYSILVGEIPNGYHVDHLCRNPKCCNPDHLEPVTPLENHRRGFSSGAITGRSGMCSKGHSMADAYVRPDTGTRMCRPCSVERGRRRRYGDTETAS